MLNHVIFGWLYEGNMILIKDRHKYSDSFNSFTFIFGKYDTYKGSTLLQTQ